MRRSATGAPRARPAPAPLTPRPLPSPSAGATVNVGIHPSNVKITKLTRMDRDRQALISRKAAGRAGKKTGDDAMVA